MLVSPPNQLLNIVGLTPFVMKEGRAAPPRYWLKRERFYITRQRMLKLLCFRKLGLNRYFLVLYRGFEHVSPDVPLSFNMRMYNVWQVCMQPSPLLHHRHRSWPEMPIFFIIYHEPELKFFLILKNRATWGTELKWKKKKKNMRRA